MSKIICDSCGKQFETCDCFDAKGREIFADLRNQLAAKDAEIARLKSDYKQICDRNTVLQKRTEHATDLLSGYLPKDISYLGTTIEELYYPRGT
jgi:hypothetical protein